MTMAKRIRQNSVWIALALAALLGGLMLLDLKRPVHEPGENPKISDIVGIAPADVTRIEINNQGRTIVLAKAGSNWTIEQPYRAAADSDVVKRIVDGVLDRTTDYIRDEPDAKEIAQYKLDKPDVSATFQDKTGRKRVIQFGDKDPGKSSVYARDVASKKVFLVGSSDVDSLRKDAGELRDKTILTVAADNIVSVTLKRPVGEVDLERAGAKWRITKPWEAPADDSSVNSLVDTLKSLKCERYIEAGAKDMKKYGLDAPRLRVGITEKGSKSHVLEIGSKAKDKNEVYAVRGTDRTEVVTLSESTFRSFDKSAGDLRNRKLVDFQESSVDRFAVTSPKGSWEAEKKSDDWTFANPFKGKKADRFKVEDAVREAAATAIRHVEENAKDLSRYGLDKPQITATVTLKGGANKQLFLGKKGPKGDYYARGSDSPNAVFELGKFSFDALNKKPEDLLEAGK